MQKWSLKCCWGCWNSSSQLHCQYRIYQDNSCTEQASRSSVLWGRDHQQDWGSLALEDCVLLCVSAGCCQWSAWKSEHWKLSEVSEAQSSVCPHNDFLLVSQLNATRLWVHEQKRLKLSIWSTYFLFEFCVKGHTIPPMLLLKFSCLCNLFSKQSPYLFFMLYTWLGDDI